MCKNNIVIANDLFTQHITAAKTFLVNVENEVQNHSKAVNGQ